MPKRCSRVLSQAPTCSSPLNKAYKDLQTLGSQRFFKSGELSWKQLFKGFDKRCEVEVTTENHDKQALLTSLGTALTDLVQMGDVTNARIVLAKIMYESGAMSASELGQIQSAPQPMPQTNSQVGGGGLSALQPTQSTQ